MKEFCGFGTREDCSRSNTNSSCDKLHFKKIINKHTDGTSVDSVFLSYLCFRQARNLNKEDAMDCGRWKKLIKIG